MAIWVGSMNLPNYTDREIGNIIVYSIINFLIIFSGYMLYISDDKAKNSKIQKD